MDFGTNSHENKTWNFDGFRYGLQKQSNDFDGFRCKLEGKTMISMDLVRILMKNTISMDFGTNSKENTMISMDLVANLKEKQ